MRQGSGAACGQQDHEEDPYPQPLLQVVAVHPQEERVAEEVEKASVKRHAGEERKELRPGRAETPSAHDLIQPAARVPERLEDGSQADVTELLYPWDQLCEQYRRLVFDAQIDLFAEQQQREFARWQTFKRNEVTERVLACPDWTRTVLETACLLDPLSRYDPDASSVSRDGLADYKLPMVIHWSSTTASENTSFEADMGDEFGS